MTYYKLKVTFLFWSFFLGILSPFDEAAAKCKTIDTKIRKFKTYQSMVETDSTYLSLSVKELLKNWPDNRNLNFVFHGHSVPSGYFKTPTVNTFGSYPFLLLKKLTEKYPTAVINIIKTCIGGENSEQGARRFKKDVLCHQPDVIFIDYALNDRYIGLARAKRAWEFMIKKALQEKITVVLMTPTPDLNENILDNNSPLAQHTMQIKEIGKKFKVSVVDPYDEFKKIKESGNDLKYYMAQNNHINELGHEIVARIIAKLFGIGIID